jgi:lipopolysaccharide/colanic/teichoic acid biosynthesis glycosyltransferase
MYKKFIFVYVSNDSTKNHLDSLISSQNLGNPIYPAKLFQARLKEEFLRTNRIQRPFLYIKIFARQFDIFGWAKPDKVVLRTWNICVLSMLSQTKFTDVVGYLSEGSGLGLILLDSDVSTLEQIRKQMLRNLHNANLLSQLRENKPKSPVFKAYVYTGLLEKKDQELDSTIQEFNESSQGFFALSRLFYSNVMHHSQKKVWRYVIKRTFDLTCTTIALLLLSPLLLIIALAVKISDPKGPIIFKQTRVGKNGKLFTMYKFRSMYADAEERKAALQEYNESGGPTFKMKNDPRIYPFGRILRKFSLDELPQLFNILKGDMSVVGPRPPVPSEVAEYLPWHKMRLSVTPGLTCFWQVSGRSNVTFEEWMRLDNQYVRHGNLGVDAQLIAKTFKVVIKGDGAY